MQHAHPDPSRAGRMHLPARAPTDPFPTTATTQTGSRNRSRSPPSSVTSHNTLVSTQELQFPDPLAATIQHGSTAAGPSDELLDNVEEVQVATGSDQARSEGTDHEAELYQSHSVAQPPPGRGRFITTPKTTRSCSVPARPLKSALIVTPPPGRTADPVHIVKKQAHFDNNATTDSLTLTRSTTAPTSYSEDFEPLRAHMHNLIFRRGSCSYDLNPPEGTEHVATLNVVNEIAGELAEVAEEQEEQGHLNEIALEVARALMEEGENVFEGDDEDDADLHSFNRSDDDCESIETDIVGCVGQPWTERHLRRSSAEEDVDGTCVRHATYSSDFADDEDDDGNPASGLDRCPQPQVLLASEDGWLERLQIRSDIGEQQPEQRHSSTETVKRPSSSRFVVMPARRESAPETLLVHAAACRFARRRSSMSDLPHSHSRVKLLTTPSKALPASCAISACTVRASESPAPNTVYQHPDARRRPQHHHQRANHVAQTVQSDAGVFQCLWEESPSSSESILTLLDEPVGMQQDRVTDVHHDAFRPPSPMAKVKTKLAAWSWAREQGLEDGPVTSKWLPLLPLEHDSPRYFCTSQNRRSEDPVGPPNTERPSGASSAKHSAPHSPPFAATISAEDDDAEAELDDEDADADCDDQPVELKVKATLARVPCVEPYHNIVNYLDIPLQKSPCTSSFPNENGHIKATRQLSSLAAEEVHFKGHRDSIVELRRRQEEERLINQQLLNSEDSMILTRAKYKARYPRLNRDARMGWKCGGGPALTTILDASPPDSHTLVTVSKGGSHGKAKSVTEALVENEYTPHKDEHVDCPIYEVERPRWFEAHFKRNQSVK